MEKSIALLLMFIALMLDIAFVKFFFKVWRTIWVLN